MFTQIDQRINELVAEQQKNDAKLAHDKSELEQLKQDCANANKQKQSISVVLEKKVVRIFNIPFCITLNCSNSKKIIIIFAGEVT